MSAIAKTRDDTRKKAGKTLRNWRKSEASNEFRLAVDCCRHAFDPVDDARLAQTAGGVDWSRFLSVVERHRIAGLAWHALRELNLPMPEETREALASKSASIAAQGLQAAVQSAEISSALDRAGIRHLFVKGLLVGALAYPSPFIKQSWDVDLLVGEEAIEESAALLRTLGFELIFPSIGTDWPRLASWHRVQKDSAWRHERSGLVVELHSRLADNPLLIPDVDVTSPTRMVTLADGIALPTLEWPEMFAHLCVHGASSAWFRLKWIADLAALVSRSTEPLESLFDRSQHLGSGRSAAQGLLLAHRLFDLQLPGRLLRCLKSDRAAIRLERAAMQQLLAPEPGDRAFGTLTIHATQLLLLPGMGFKLAESRRQLAAAFSNLID